MKALGVVLAFLLAAFTLFIFIPPFFIYVVLNFSMLDIVTKGLFLSYLVILTAVFYSLLEARGVRNAR